MELREFISVVLRRLWLILLARENKAGPARDPGGLPGALDPL